MGDADTFLLCIIAIIFPPAAVAFISGCSGDLCLNLLLTCLGWLPGCIHAFWLILRRAEANEKYGYKNWTYMGNGRFRAIPVVVVPAGQQPYPYAQPPPPPPPAQQPPPAGYTAPPAEQKPAPYTAPPPSQPPATTGEQKSGDYTAPPPPPA